jgi:hypothetical protein
MAPPDILENTLAMFNEAETKLPTWRAGLAEHMDAYAALMTRLPGGLGLGGTYAGPHLTRKRLCVVLQTAQNNGSEPSRLLGKVTLGQLNEWSPDQGAHLAALPTTMSCQELMVAFGTKAPHLLGMYACLFHPVFKNLGPKVAVQKLMRSPSSLRATRDAYRRKNGINPHPWVLVENM